MTLINFHGGCHTGLGNGARLDCRVTALLLLLVTKARAWDIGLSVGAGWSSPEKKGFTRQL